MIETVQKMFDTVSSSDAANSAAVAATQGTNWSAAYAALGAGIAAIGVLGTGIGQGFAAGKAAEAIGRNPEAETKVRLMFFIGAGVAETSAIYATIISFVLMFVVRTS